MWLAVALLLCPAAGADTAVDLLGARDKQDRGALEKIVAQLMTQAEKRATDARALYMLAIAESYLAEINLELRLKNEARAAAEAGIRAAEKAVSLKNDVADYHRVLGTLCGQVIPANVLAGLKYGRCALDSVNKAIQMDPKSSGAFLARGVGNYYLPTQFGGGVDLAIRDIQKAIELDAKSADAYMWLGVAYRKKNQFPDARKALQKSLELNPSRIWTKQLLEKTPK